MKLECIQLLANEMNMTCDRIEVLDECDKVLGNIVEIQADWIDLWSDLVDVLSEFVVVHKNSFLALWFEHYAGAEGGHYGGREWASAGNATTQSNRTGEFLDTFSLCVSS